MHRLRATLLQHETRSGRHFDLLIEDPTLGPPRLAPLWAARVSLPPAAWVAAGVLRLVPLPPHRRIYLDYQGPLTGGRGRVSRVASGHAVPRLWTAGRIEMSLRLGAFSGRLDLQRRSNRLWIADVWADANA